MHTILIVDSDSAGRMVLKAILEESGYKVVTAISESDAWEQAHGVGFTCSFVLIDADALDMSALSLTKRLRKMAKLRVTPILIASDEPMQGRMEKSAQRAGATGFLQKPFAPSKLIAIIQGLARYPTIE